MNALEMFAGLDWWTIAGWTMLHYFWLGLVVGAVAGVIRFALRRASAQVRYGAALVSLVALAVLPVGIGIGVGGRVSGVRESVGIDSEDVSAKPQAVVGARRGGAVAPVVGDGDLAKPQAASETVDKDIAAEIARGVAPVMVHVEPIAARSLSDWSAFVETAARWLPWVWIVGAPVTFLLLCTGVLGAERLRRESRLVNDGPVVECLERLRGSLSIGRRVAVAVCERVAAPVLVGVVRPLILLPPSALSGWSPDEIEMVLLHELAHVRRWDNLVNLVQRFVEAALFFQPAVWLVSGWVRREREACCDAVVVGRTQRPQAYAELLVALAAQLPRSVLFHPAAASAMAAGPLRGRIRRILGIHDDPMLVSGKSLGVVMSGLLLAATLVVLNLPTRSEAEQKTDLTTEGTEDTEEKTGVRFVVGASRFDDGDTIEISQVRGTRSTFEPGGTYWIEGSYTLASRDRASLSAFVTARNAGDRRTSIDQGQTMVVERGSGKFTLKLPMPYPGWPHVSFYPDGGGEGFGGAYFGTGDSVLKKWWDAYGSGGARSVEPIATVDRVKETAANTQVYWSKSILPGGEFDLQPLFVASDENPLLTMSYPVPPSLQKNLSLGFEAMKMDQFGPKLKFESRWIGDRSAFEITAPKQAHLFFSNFVPWVIAAEGKRSTAAASDAKSIAEKSATEVAEDNGVAYHKQVGVGGNLPVEVSEEDERRIIAEVQKNPAVRSASIKRGPDDLQMLVTSVVPPPGKKAFLTWKTDSEGRLSCSIEFVVPPKLAEKTQAAERGGAELAPITIAKNAKSPRSDEETRRVTLGIRENQTATAELEPGRLRLQIRTTESAMGKFPTLEEQKLADLAYRRLGIELEQIGTEDLKRVKALGYDGGVKVTNDPHAMSRAGVFQEGDILVGLAVWPTRSLKEVAEVLNRDDLAELSPLKFYVVRPDGDPRRMKGPLPDKVVADRISVELEQPERSRRTAANRYSEIPARTARPREQALDSAETLTSSEWHKSPIRGMQSEQAMRDRPIFLLFAYHSDEDSLKQHFSEVFKELKRLHPGRIDGAIIDLANDPTLSRSFKLDKLPTCIVYDRGKEFRRYVGEVTKEQLQSAIEDIRSEKTGVVQRSATGLPVPTIPNAVAPTADWPGNNGNQESVPVSPPVPEDVLRALRERGPLTLEVFYVDGSGPCQQMRKILQEFGRANLSLPVKIEMRNAEVHRAETARHGITRVPTLVWLRDGEVVKKSNGASSVVDFANQLFTVARALPEKLTADTMAEIRVNAALSVDPNLETLQQELMSLEHQLNAQEGRMKTGRSRDEERLKALIAEKQKSIDAYRTRIQEAHAKANEQAISRRERRIGAERSPWDSEASHEERLGLARRAELRYDGKSFVDWRTEWQTELSTAKRIEAVKALAAFGANGQGAEAAVEIVALAGQYPWDVRIGDSNDSVDKLREACLAAFGHQQVSGLTQRIPDAEAAPVIVEAARSKQRDERMFAICILSGLARTNEGAAEALVKLTYDPDALVRNRAIECLASIGSTADAKITGRLQEILSSDDAEAAALALANLRNAESLDVDWLHFLLHRKDEVRWQALRSLAAMRQNNPEQFDELPQIEKLRQQLLGIWDDASRAADHAAAIRGLAQVSYGDEEMHVRLDTLMMNRDAPMPLRVAAMQALTQITGNGSIENRLRSDFIEAHKVQQRTPEFRAAFNHLEKMIHAESRAQP